MNELNIKQKDLLGQGVYHSVFPYQKFADKIIKTRKGEVDFGRDGKPFYKSKDGMNMKEMEIFQSHPDIFAKVYKLTDKYAVIERLNTDQIVSDMFKLQQGIFNFWKEHPHFSGILTRAPYPIDSYNSDPIDIDAANYLYLAVVDGYDKLLKKLEKYCPKDLYLKYLSFLQNVVAAKLPKRRVDLHDKNIGYDKNGNFKLLDF